MSGLLPDHLRLTVRISPILRGIVVPAGDPSLAFRALKFGGNAWRAIRMLDRRT